MNELKCPSCDSTSFYGPSIFNERLFTNLCLSSDIPQITKVKSIIITTDAGDIILAPCKDTTVSLTTTETFGLLDCLTKKEATIEAEYDNMVFIK